MKKIMFMLFVSVINITCARAADSTLYYLPFETQSRSAVTIDDIEASSRHLLKIPADSLLLADLLGQLQQKSSKVEFFGYDVRLKLAGEGLPACLVDLECNVLCGDKLYRCEQQKVRTIVGKMHKWYEVEKPSKW